MTTSPSHATVRKRIHLHDLERKEQTNLLESQFEFIVVLYC